METLLQKAQRLGIKPSTPKQGFIQGLASKAEGRADTVGYILSSQTKSPLAKARQVFGQGAGLGADIVGAGIGKIASAVTPDFIEKPAMQLAGKIGGAIAQSSPVQSSVSAYQIWSQKHPEAAAELGALGNVANLATSFTGGSIGAKGIVKAGAETGNIVGKGIAKTGQGVGKLGAFGASQTFGLNKDTVGNIIKNPELFHPKEIAKIDRESIFQKVKSATEKRIESLSETGKLYEGIKKSGEKVLFQENPILKVLNKYGIHVDETGKVITTAESVPLSGGDIKEIEGFISQYGKPELSANGFLNARKALSNLSKFSTEKTDMAGKIARELRHEYDAVGKQTLTGLAGLDAKYAPEIQLLTKVKASIFAKDGSIKPNAISTIANLTGKGKEQLLPKIEKIVPGITKDVNILKSIEDIHATEGQKVGTYMRTLIGAGGGAAAGGPVGALLGAIATSPQVGVALLRTYGKLKGISKSIIDGIVGKMESGKKLIDNEVSIMSKALDNGLKKLVERSSKIRTGMSVQDVSGGKAGYSNPLLQEARSGKYANAEEFVNSKKTAYHGGNIDDVENFDPEFKIGDSRNDPLSNIGINLGDRNTAQFFADRKGGKVVETYLDPKKVKKTTYNNLLHEIADVMEERSGVSFGQQIRRLRTTDAKNEFLIDNLSDPEIAKEIADKYRAQGFDMITYKNTLDGGEAYIPLTKDAIKTKSQLTDLWKKAQGGTKRGFGTGAGRTAGPSKATLKEEVSKTLDNHLSNLKPSVEGGVMNFKESTALNDLNSLKKDLSKATTMESIKSIQQEAKTIVDKVLKGRSDKLAPVVKNETKMNIAIEKAKKFKFFDEFSKAYPNTPNETLKKIFLASRK